MKDIYGDEVEIGTHVEIFVGTYPHINNSFGSFLVREGVKGLYFEDAKSIATLQDLKDFGLNIRIVDQCSECGEWFDKSEYGYCTICGYPVCENCQQPCKGPPHPFVDYSVHRTCYKNEYE